MTKNGVQFLIGWCDFPLDKDDTWEPITNLPGSEHMIAEFQKHRQEEYKIKTSEQLQSVIDKRNTRHEKNTQTQRDRNTTTDMDEVRTDGDDDDGRVILRMTTWRMRMGQPRTPNGDRLEVLT
jgi:hypothetical protein